MLSLFGMCPSTYTCCHCLAFGMCQSSYTCCHCLACVKALTHAVTVWHVSKLLHMLSLFGMCQLYRHTLIVCRARVVSLVCVSMAIVCICGGSTTSEGE